MNDEATDGMTGKVIEVLPKALYRVELQSGQVVVAGLGQTLRHVVSRLVVGDRVVLQISPHDPNRGRITQRAS